MQPTLSTAGSASSSVSGTDFRCSRTSAPSRFCSCPWTALEADAQKAMRLCVTMLSRYRAMACGHAWKGTSEEECWARARHVRLPCCPGTVQWPVDKEGEDK